jgi:hypothetical protein
MSPLIYLQLLFIFCLTAFQQMTKLLQKFQYWIAADPNAMVEGLGK